MVDATQITTILFENLPTEILEKVCSFLDGDSLLNACCVSKQWSSLISGLHAVWKKICFDYGTGDLLKSSINWKFQYLQCRKLIHKLNKGTALKHSKFIPEAFHGSLIRGLAYSKSYLIAGVHNQISVWDTRNIILIGTYNVPPKISCLSMSNEEFILGTGQHNGHIITWKLQNDTLSHLKEFVGHTEKILCINIMYKLNLMASGAEDRTVWLWELSSGNSLRTLNIHAIPQEVKLTSSSSTSLTVITSDTILLYTWSENINKSTELYHPLPVTELQHICVLDHRVLYGGEYAGEVVVRNMHSWNQPYYFKLKTDKTVNIIAAGERFLLAEFQESEIRYHGQCLAIVDWIKGSIIGVYCMPRALDQVMIGETDWMNGLTYQKDGEPILISSSTLQASVTFDVISWK